MTRRKKSVIVDDRYSTGEPFEKLPINADRRDSFITTMLRLSAMWDDTVRDVPISEIHQVWMNYYSLMARDDEMETDRAESWLVRPQVAGKALREIIIGANEDPKVWVRRKAKGYVFKLNYRTFIPMVWNFGEALWHDDLEPQDHIGKKLEVIARRIASLCQTRAQVAFLKEFSDYDVQFNPENVLDF